MTTGAEKLSAGGFAIDFSSSKRVDPRLPQHKYPMNFSPQEGAVGVLSDVERTLLGLTALGLDEQAIINGTGLCYSDHKASIASIKTKLGARDLPQAIFSAIKLTGDLNPLELLPPGFTVAAFDKLSPDQRRILEQIGKNGEISDHALAATLTATQGHGVQRHDIQGYKVAGYISRILITLGIDTRTKLVVLSTQLKTEDEVVAEVNKEDFLPIDSDHPEGELVITPNQRSLLGLLAQGLSDGEIGIALGTSSQNVKERLQILMLKNRTTTREGVIALAFKTESADPTEINKLLRDKGVDFTQVRRLTKGQKKILRFFLESNGGTNHTISDLCNITEGTCGAHMREIFQRLYLTNRSEAMIVACLARQDGLI